jgi:hypothetical protein
MPVVEAVQTFVGIVNENEFYSHCYLFEVFKGDIRERPEHWAAAEEADPEQRAPYKRLASLSGQWFARRNPGNRVGDAEEQLAAEIYLKGYSLESLRNLELTPLHAPQARDRLSDVMIGGTTAIHDGRYPGL